MDIANTFMYNNNNILDLCICVHAFFYLPSVCLKQIALPPHPLTHSPTHPLTHSPSRPVMAWQTNGKQLDLRKALTSLHTVSHDASIPSSVGEMSCGSGSVTRVIRGHAQRTPSRFDLVLSVFFVVVFVVDLLSL